MMSRFVALVFLVFLAVPGSFASDGGVLGVNDFLKSDSDDGTVVRVAGAVSVVYPDAGRLSIIDLKDLPNWRDDDCCAGIPLTVLWKGEMPMLKGQVEVTGKVKKRGRAMRLIATEVEVTKKPWEN